MGGGASVAGRAEADPALAFVLLRLAEDIVWPVTAVSGEEDPCADSFALDEVGCVLLSALRDWARDSPSTAVPGIARTIIRFAVNVIPNPDHADTADALEAMRDEHLVLAHAMRSTPGAHRVAAPRWGWARTHPVRATAHPVRIHPVGGAHRCGRRRGSGAHAPADSQMLPEGRHLTDAIGYLMLPPVPSDRVAAPYVRSARSTVNALDEQGTCGWVIDMRSNSGGDMWGPLAAVGPILGDGTVGETVYADGEKIPWTIENGTPRQYLDEWGPAPSLTRPMPAVAVLTSGRTASAAEAVTIAFQGRPHSRTFGQPTAGVPTANAPYRLSDGALVILPIAPDVNVSVGQRPDHALTTATDWLRTPTRTRCAGRGVRRGRFAVAIRPLSSCPWSSHAGVLAGRDHVEGQVYGGLELCRGRVRAPQ
ncbi:S41 family peptidase [Streptomyces lateritius]|uniref:S41 family peptidase n=1 Tax=Streptomyces lateritius TaxID=67313 RepID=A0ABW6YMM5_9ACTN